MEECGHGEKDKNQLIPSKCCHRKESLSSIKSKNGEDYSQNQLLGEKMCMCCTGRDQERSSLVLDTWAMKK